MREAVDPQTYWLYTANSLLVWISVCVTVTQSYKWVMHECVRHAHTKTHTHNSDREATESNLTLGWAEIGRHSQSLTGQAGTLHNPTRCVCEMIAIEQESQQERENEQAGEKSCSWRSRVVRLVERRDCLEFRVCCRSAGCQFPPGLLHDIH